MKLVSISGIGCH